MMVTISLDSLKTIKPHEIALRFLFGGTCTAAAYLISMHYGPAVGGLFLAFPAIFPASASLIEKHEKEDKAAMGSDGTERGRVAAGLDAEGTAMGCVGLMAFALFVWRALASQRGLLVLAEASGLWLVASVSIWLVFKCHADKAEPSQIKLN